VKRFSKASLREAADALDDLVRARLEVGRAVLDAVSHLSSLPLDHLAVPAQSGRASPLEAVQAAAEGLAIAVGLEHGGDPIARLESRSDLNQDDPLTSAGQCLQIGLLGRQAKSSRACSLLGAGACRATSAPGRGCSPAC
jgi:hypothetical protein